MLVTLVCLDGSSIVQAASDIADKGLISFQSKCNCSLSMSCSCCQSAVVNAMNLTKSVCVTFKINLLKASVDVSVSLDGNSVSKFTLDTKTPPSFCLPVISDITPLALCLKMTTKMSGLTNLNICPSFYSSFDANQILAYDFKCIKLGMDGFSIV
ncbi:uncharacterized protein LOC117792212 [Drosophila innubila]|uniref:uncharacterized protein LOC117792212 n=1 Tax=Drosophila innubila TaxID=198719 RepID=UPI00148D5157|nr:uncharacterized protein LOC117792212 [Drosophila innubila]